MKQQLTTKKLLIIITIFTSLILVNSGQCLIEDLNFIDIENKFIYKPPRSFIFGEIIDLNSSGYFTSFKAINILIIQLTPLYIKHFNNNEEITVADNYLRSLTPNFAWGYFGFIGAATNHTPRIDFINDIFQRTLTVDYVENTSLLWSDFGIIGICNTFQLGSYIKSGDKILNCNGSIQIIYLPTEILVGYWNFN